MKHVFEFQRQSGVELPNFAQEFVNQLMVRLKKHDLGTYEHCLRVSQLALNLGSDMGLNKVEQCITMFSGLLHDVGKIKVPSYIINKPNKLTSAEYDVMKKHTEFGVELIQPLTKLLFFEKVSTAILYHHERMDGAGYHQLPVEQIPLVSRIILVVDTVDAMMQDRAYRKGLSMPVVIDELIKCSGTQFDPQIVETYLSSLDKKKMAA